MAQRLELRADLAIQAQQREHDDASVVAEAAGLSAAPAWLPAAAWAMRLVAVAVIVALAAQAGPSGLWLGALVAAVLGFPLDAWVAKQFDQAGEPLRLSRTLNAWSAALEALQQRCAGDAALASWREEAAAAVDGCRRLSAWAEARIRRGNPLWQALSAIMQAQAGLGVVRCRRMRCNAGRICWPKLKSSCFATWTAEHGGVWASAATGANSHRSRRLGAPAVAV